MDKVSDLLHRLGNANRYAVATGLFLMWMLTLADVDLFRMMRTRAERADVERKLEGHRERISALESELSAFQGQPASMEKHAREAHYMHKPNEDVFVFR